MSQPSTKKLQAALRALEALSLRDLQAVDAGAVGSAAKQIREALAAKAAPVTYGDRHLGQLLPGERMPTSAEAQFVREGRKINAIKAVRERTFLGLRDAMSLVESWQQNGAAQ